MNKSKFILIVLATISITFFVIIALLQKMGYHLEGSEQSGMIMLGVALLANVILAISCIGTVLIDKREKVKATPRISWVLFSFFILQFLDGLSSDFKAWIMIIVGILAILVMWSEYFRVKK